MYRTPDLCQRLQTFGLLQRFGRSCCGKRESNWHVGSARNDKLRSARSHLIIALEWLERIHSRQGRWISDPLKRLPVGDDVNVVHGVDGVEELDEAFFVVRLCEPGSVVEETEGCTIRRVMSLEVLHDHLLDILGLGWVGTGVTHRATSTVQVLPHHHGDFPHAWIALGRAGRDHAVVEELVVECVRPAGWTVLVHRHRRVVSEVEVVQHLEHSVASDGEERRSHASDVFLLDAAISRQDFALTSDFTCPLFE
jgi:hypothetical protein